MTEDDKFWDEVCVWLGQRSVKEAFSEALKFEGENKQLKARIVQLEKFLRYTAETRHVDFTKMEALLDFRVCDSNRQDGHTGLVQATTLVLRSPGERPTRNALN